jgi:polyhydroxyalkanoate synthesis regulator phasin
LQNELGTDANLASRFHQYQEDALKRAEKKAEEICEKHHAAVVKAADKTTALEVEIQKLRALIVTLDERVTTLEETQAADDGFGFEDFIP